MTPSCKTGTGLGECVILTGYCLPSMCMTSTDWSCVSFVADASFDGAVKSDSRGNEKKPWIRSTSAVALMTIIFKGTPPRPARSPDCICFRNPETRSTSILLSWISSMITALYCRRFGSLSSSCRSIPSVKNLIFAPLGTCESKRTAYPTSPWADFLIGQPAS